MWRWRGTFARPYHHGVTSHQEIVAGLRRDYERVALAGIKRLRGPEEHSLEADHAASLERLIAVDLAAAESDAFTLLRADHCAVELDDSTRDVLQALFSIWLRSDDGTPDDEVLYGELGYWQHWWNMLHSRPDRDQHPLAVEMLVADDGTFSGRAWLQSFDDKILEYVSSQQLLAGRVIVPPDTLNSPAESLVEWASTLGLSIRVFPSPSQYVIYDGEAAVLRDDTADDELERHRLTRNVAVVEPLRRLFDLQWAAAIPWEEYSKGTAGILHLLAQGWTDARIADAMGVSMRTVSRRVSDAMTAAGVQSRFELGMKYALTELGRKTP